MPINLVESKKKSQFVKFFMKPINLKPLTESNCLQ